MSENEIIQLDILEDFKNYIVPLQPEEYKQLEKNILREGCRDPLVVWKSEEKRYLLDGHNRYRICTTHNLSFDITELEFEDKEKARLWIINNQLGKRNLNPDQMSYYRGLKYENLKKARGGYEYVESKGQNVLPTSEKIAREFNVSERTIKRDARFTRGLNFIGDRNPELKNDILMGEVNLNKSDINLLADENIQKKIRKIVNAKDLQVKINKIREDILDEIESKLDKKKKNNVEEAQNYLKSKEPVFANYEDRINQIKGQMLSQVNRAIKEKNVKALDEIEKLVEKLKMLLLDSDR